MALAGLVVLEPVEHILALGRAQLPQPPRDLLDLLRGGRADALIVQRLQDRYLLPRRVPTAGARRRRRGWGSPVLLLLLLLLLH